MSTSEFKIADDVISNQPEEFNENGYFFSNVKRGEGSKSNSVYATLSKQGNEDWMIPFVIEFKPTQFRIDATNFGMYEAKGEDVEKDFRYWFKRAVAKEIEHNFGRDESSRYWNWCN